MTCPVFLDGPLEGEQHEMTADTVEQGIYVMPGGIIYTFSRVMVLGRVLVTASVSNGMPDLSVLYEHLVSEQAKRAAE